MPRRDPSIDELSDLVATMRQRLRATGSVIDDVGHLEVPVNDWRKAARRAGRELGRPLRTLVHGGVVQAYLMDWPVDADERLVYDRAMRAAVEAASSSSNHSVRTAVDGSAQS